MTHRLRSAMLRAQLDSAALATAVAVDVKTVNRWLSGRVPHRRTRIAVAGILGEPEENLWPQARPDLASGAPPTAEVVAAYGHRADVPREAWISMFLEATEKIDILGYAYPFIFELLPDAVARLERKCLNGTDIRLAFADPTCAHVAERDRLEQMGDTLVLQPDFVIMV